MVIDKIKKFNDTDKSNSEKNEKASEMLIEEIILLKEVKYDSRQNKKKRTYCQKKRKQS